MGFGVLKIISYIRIYQKLSFTGYSMLFFIPGHNIVYGYCVLHKFWNGLSGGLSMRGIEIREEGGKLLYIGHVAYW